MKKKYFLVILLVALIALSGCASAPKEASSVEAPNAPALGSAPVQEPNYSLTAKDSESEAASSAESSEGCSDQRIVIRTAELSIAVPDPAKSMDAISRMADSMGGYIVSSSLHKTTNRNGIEFPEADISVRVPAEKLNDALAQIRGQVEDAQNDILYENVTGQDVTKDYTDLNSRLKNLEETEVQLREIMASATKTEDVLAVYQQLSQVREEIEVTKGQIKYYEESAALSSINVHIQAKASIQPIQVGGWKPVGTARNAVQALIDTLQFLAKAAIWIVILVIPVVVVVFGPLALIIWLIRRGAKNRRKQPPAAMPPEAPVEN